MQILSQFSGGMMLLGFFAAMIIATALISQRSRDLEGFMVANRQVGQWTGAFSIAATWIWAPALFIAAEKAFTQGWVGLFWFTVPNVLCLILFSEFAVRLRDRLPKGYTLSQYMAKRYGGRVQSIYMLELIGLSTCSFAVQLLAGGLIFSTITGLPFPLVTCAMAIIALSYSMMSGLRASVITDHIQLIIILLVCVTFVPWAVYSSGGLETLIAGLAGHSGQFTSLFSGAGGNVFWSFGIAVTIGLMSGPFGDQSFWQRSLAIEKKKVRKAFVWGALVFGIVPIMLSGLGFIVAGSGLVPPDTQLTNLFAIIKFLPAWTAVPFGFMLMCGLVSTLDSALCAISSIAGKDIADILGFSSGDQDADQKRVRFGRWIMALAMVVGIAIANIPGMKILYLFLFYGTMRASVLIPTILTLIYDRVSEKGVFYGICLSITVGLPLFTFGKFGGHTMIAVLGSLLTVGLSGIVAMAYTTLEKERGIISESNSATAVKRY